MAIVTLKLNVAADQDITPALIKNAVRRAMEATDLSEDKGEVKGIRYNINRPKTKIKVPKTEAGVVRAWARQNGLTVGQRGRIRPDVLAAYTEAN